MKRIQVCLGGYVAEEMVFGKEYRTTGAFEDLRNATEIASKMVRDFGMGENYIASTCYYTEGNNCRAGHVIKEFDDTLINNEIRSIIDTCHDKVKEILESPEWKRMLKESAIYLCEHSSMPKKKMKQLYEQVDKKVRELPDKKAYYRDKIQNMC